jgi:hypothetical protein
MSAPGMDLTAPTVTVTIINTDTNVRTGGSTRGPDNKIAVLQKGPVQALYQCTGEEVSQSTGRNFWWVKVLIPQSDGAGWVSATNIKESGDNEKVKDVPERPTVFE